MAITKEEWDAAADWVTVHWARQMIADLTPGQNPLIPPDELRSVLDTLDGWENRLYDAIPPVPAAGTPPPSRSG